MQDFVSFWASLLPVVCEFLLSEPIIWFVGILVLIFMISFLAKLIK